MKTRRILSSILSFVMIFTLVVYSPRVTFAENNTAPVSESVQNDGKKDNLKAEDSLEGMVEGSEDDEKLNDGTRGSSDESKDSGESKDTGESKSTDESQGADESKNTDESKGTDESKDVDESKGTDESKDTDESNGTDESKDANESNGTDESKDADESNSTDESKEVDESNGTDESKETGSADDADNESKESSSAADESSSTDESKDGDTESSAANDKESEAAGDESSASDEKESSAASDESSAVDESGSAGDQEESSAADESSEAETGAADESTAADDSTQNGSTGGGSVAGGGSGTTLASDSNASVGGGSGTMTNGQSQKLTAEQVADMPFDELYEYIMSLETDEEREAVLKLLSEEDYLEFLDYVAMIEFVDPVNLTEAGPLLLMPQVKMAAKVRSLMRSNTTVPDGLVLSKTFTPNVDEDGKQDGSGTLRLEAYTTGRVTSTESSTPLDIVLVLDQSGSMKDYFGSGSSYSTKQAALKKAVDNFIGNVATEARTKNVDHRIAIVTYGSNASRKIGLTSVKENESNLKNIINGLPERPSGSTNTKSGMEMAVNILKGSERNSVVILFTDGVPTKSSSFNFEVANGAINAAKTLKANGTTVYAVGIFSGADSEVLYGTNNSNNMEPGIVGYTWQKKKNGNDESILANRFMNFVSSNYPEAADMGLEETQGSRYKITKVYNRVNADDDYYLTASDSTSLNEIFDSIAQSIGEANIELGTKAYLQDVISPYFKLADDVSKSDIDVYTDDCTGVDSNGEYTFENKPEKFGEAIVTVGDDNKTIKVENFDYDAYYVRNTELNGTFGKKLIVEIPIVADYETTGTFGGNGFPTNLENGNSGIFNDDGLIGGFESPHGNLPVRYEFDVQNKSIYLSNDFTDLEDLIETVTGFVPGQDAGNEKNNSRVQIVYTFAYGDQTATYTIAPGKSLNEGVLNGSISALSDMKDDVTLEISCTISAINDDDNENENPLDKQTATIYVYRPAIPFKDSCIYLGESADYQDNESGPVAWNYPDTSKQVPAIDSSVSKPTILYTEYTPAAGKFDKETHVKVSKVKVGDLEFNMENETDKPYIGFSHDTCSGFVDNCKFDPTEGQFLVHLKTCSLTIKKEVTNDKVEDTQQVFLFTVFGPDNAKWQVSIVGEGEKKITGLPIGNYTVTENTDWSWRYTCNDPTKTAQLSGDKTSDSVTVTITNELTNEDWLSDETETNNEFGQLTSELSQRAFLRKEEKYEFA